VEGKMERKEYSTLKKESRENKKEKFKNKTKSTVEINPNISISIKYNTPKMVILDFLNFPTICCLQGPFWHRNSRKLKVKGLKMRLPEKLFLSEQAKQQYPEK
jgi:hypothetical protein